MASGCWQERLAGCRQLMASFGLAIPLQVGRIGNTVEAAEARFA